MYDKVKFFVPSCGKPQQIGGYLYDAKEQIDLNTGEVCTLGVLDGLKVSAFGRGVSIVGSLPKFMYKSNIYPMDRHSTQEAIKKLSDCLHMECGTAKVVGLEFGANFVMRQPVGEYLKRLGDIPRLSRYQMGNTVYYKHRGKQKLKEFCFYDKAAEARTRGVTLPVGFEGANLLRYEMRLKGYLSRQLKRATVEAKDLYSVELFGQLVTMWQEYYNSIAKVNKREMNDTSNIKTVTDAYNAFVAYLISQSDKRQIATFMENLKKEKVFDDRKYYTRLKKKISSAVGGAVVDEAIIELNDEVKNIAANF